MREENGEMSNVMKPPSKSNAKNETTQKASANRSSNRIIYSLLAWLFAYALWQGGFIFYSGAVVPLGAEVLESDTMQGFVTQRVTNVLNVIGLAAVTLYFFLIWSNRMFRGQKTIPILYLILLTTAIALPVLHWKLDSQLIPDSVSIVEGRSFYRWHRVYMLVSIVQMFVAIWLTIHFFTCLLREKAEVHWQK